MISIFWGARYITQHYKRCIDYRERIKSGKQLSQSHWNHTSPGLRFSSLVVGKSFPPNEKAALAGHLRWTYKSVQSEAWEALAHIDSVIQQPPLISQGEVLPLYRCSVPASPSTIPWCCSSSFLHLFHAVLPDTQILKTCPTGLGSQGGKFRNAKQGCTDCSSRGSWWED